jgi:hypothetical protein
LSKELTVRPVTQSPWLQLAGAALPLGSCVFDPNARCGEHMEEYEDAVKCVCVEGYAMTESGCVKCRANESPGASGCECDVGFERDDDGRCRRAMDPGSGCDASAASCSEEPAPPTGVGMACSSDDDCAGTDASYCETLVSQSCLVPGCTTDDDCYQGNECCDLTAFGMPTLCVPEGSCP